MIIEGTKILAAPRGEVWQALEDPAFLLRVVPDCRAMSRTEDGGYRATIAAGVGPIRASFDADIARSVLEPGRRFSLSGQGTAGAAGAARGSVTVALEDVAGGTQLSYRAETEVTGKVAQLGARMIDGAARKFSEQFFANVQRELGAGQGGAAEAPGRAAAAAVAVRPQAAASAWQGFWIPLACGVGCFLGTFFANLLR